MCYLDPGYGSDLDNQTVHDIIMDMSPENARAYRE